MPDLAGAAPTEEQAAEIRHLLEDPGLGLTREELETLFDLVDEADAGRGRGSLSSSSSGGGGQSMSRSRHRLGVRLADRGLILFLRRRGRRRSE